MKKIIFLSILFVLSVIQGCGVKGDPTPAIDRIDVINEDSDSGSNSKK